MQHDDVEKCIVFGEKLSIPNIIAYVGHVWLDECDVHAMRKKI